jgi:hypothetical protein
MINEKFAFALFGDELREHACHQVFWIVCENRASSGVVVSLVDTFVLA